MSIFSPVFFKKNFEDSQVMKGAESILKAKRGYSFRIPPKNTPVVLIVSGGMDSIMLWFYLLAIYKLHVYPIHFTGPHSVLGEQLSVNFFYSYFKKLFHTDTDEKIAGFKRLIIAYFAFEQLINVSEYKEFLKRKKSIIS